MTASSFEKLWDIDTDNIASLLRGFNFATTPLPMRKPTEVLPGIYSFDPVFLEFVETLSDMLNDAPQLQPHVDKNMMVGENGIHIGFDRLRTVAGYASSPLSYPTVDNSKICDDLNIPRDFRNDRHRQIFDELSDVLFGHWKPSPLKVPKKSTFGMPMMYIYEADYKRSFALWAFSNIETILAKVAKKDFVGLAEDFAMIFCFNLNRRGQVDDPNKVRYSNDLEFALSGGRRGKRVVADKTVRIDGVVYDRFSAMRERIVQGATWAINCIIQVLYTGHMYAMFEMFPLTFHPTDNNEVAKAEQKEGDATHSDVKTYDETMRSFLTHRKFDNMKKYWDDRLVDISKTLFYAPYYARPLSVKEEGVKQRGQFVGNPMKPDAFEVQSGNRSGHGGTSYIAKFMKVFDSLTVIDDIFKDVVGKVASYLRHEGRIKLVNNGDDEGAFGSPAAIAMYRKFRYDGNHGYFSVEPEVGQGFSGDLMDWGRGIAIPRMQTTFEKCYVPERSIGGTFRPRWPIGFVTRFDNLANLDALTGTDSGSIAIEIHRKAWRDKMEPKFGSFTEIMARAIEGLDIEMNGLTAIDKEVLDDEEKLFYKYTIDDLSPQVAEKIVTKIEPEHFEWALKMYRGFVI